MVGNLFGSFDGQKKKEQERQIENHLIPYKRSVPSALPSELVLTQW